MEQRSIVLYLNGKGLRAQLMHEDLVARLGPEATAYSTVTICFQTERIILLDATPFSPSLHLTSMNQMRPS
jgi:hypothetical protein